MAKNYASLYASSNDAIALEQRFYVKEEVTRGVFVAPTGADFIRHLPGGQIAFEQPFESSPQRSGRHHSSIIRKKKITNWNFSTYFNIDTSLGAAGTSEIDPAARVLWESLLGRETTPAGPKYDAATAPSLTFSLFEVGDKWARQSPGGFVQGGNIQLPGDGEAMVEWSGNAKTSYLVGIGKSTVDNDTANIVTLQADEAWRFPVGALVMIIEADGTTRSADTPDGSPRTVTAHDTGADTVTLSGAVLADADGSVTPIYLVYYEPAAPTAINDPVSGLVGSVSIVGLASQCVRSLNINVQNNHELKDYCYGEDGLGTGLFVPGDRMTAELSLTLNLNDDLIEFFNQVTEFEAKDILAVLGSATGRRVEFDIPSARFQVPAFSVPDTGSIPVEFSGTAYESSFDAADELTVEFK